jgi:aldehyde dehydrogenase (NAD+)
VRGFTLGNPLDKETQIGPLVTAEHRERVLSYIELGRSSGARLTVGGGIPADHPQGWFVSPTVFADVDNSWRVAREEIFGPVICLMAYDNLDHAVEIANDSEYGLAGMVWTPDEEQGRKIADRIHAGTVGVNTYGLDLRAPFGGVKASGVGRELGPEGLSAYFSTKSVYFPTAV